MISILGASGFIGSAVAARAAELGLPHRAYGRRDPVPTELGRVIYCIGLTADFRTRPLDAVRGHVSYLVELVAQHRFERLVYLSSTRVYRESASEGDRLSVNPLDPSDLYNISKAMGESVTATCGERGTSVRLSNVYGPDLESSNFLSDVLRQAIQGRIELQTTLESSKDYVSVRDVANVLLEIALRGKAPLYNVASGRNTSNAELVATLRAQLGCEANVAAGARTTTFPQIDIERVRQELGFSPRSVLDDLPELVRQFRREREGKA